MSKLEDLKAKIMAMAEEYKQIKLSSPPPILMPK